MSKTASFKLTAAIFTACTLVLVLVGTTFHTADADAVRPDPRLGYTPPAEEQTAPAPEIEVNEKGQTFGIRGDLLGSEDPDLILVAATNGKTGYVLKTELDEATRANLSPEEAFALQETYEAFAADMLRVSLSEEVTGGELSLAGATEIIQKLQMGDTPEIDYESIAEEAVDDYVATARSGIDRSTLPSGDTIEEEYAEIVAQTTVFIPVYESDGDTVIGEYPVTQL